MGEETRVPRVAIIGGGCAGVIAAAHLLLDGRAVHVTVLEASGVIGRGPAYGTSFELHELNTVAEEMSALVSRPLDFVEWSSSVGTPAVPGSFASRAHYGRYLGALLSRLSELGHPASSLEVLHAEAVAITERVADGPRELSIGLANGAHLVADEVILAIGMPTGAPHWASKSLGPGVIVDPWAPGALDGITADDEILLVGTGLTMVDVAVELSERQRCRKMFARSRHGLLPLLHHQRGRPPATARDAALLGIHPERSARKLVRSIRQACAKAESEGRDWQDVVAEIRLAAPSLWRELPVPEQRRILRHALRYWEIHRHRITPAASRRIEALVDRGLLDIEAGRVVDATPSPNGVHVELRGPQGREALDVNVIVNCTGPGGGFESMNRFIGFLVEGDIAHLSENGLSFALEPNGDLRLGDGDSTIHTIGWIRKGIAFESTGVPEIRVQAADLAARLLTR